METDNLETFEGATAIMSLLPMIFVAGIILSAVGVLLKMFRTGVVQASIL